MGRYRGDIGEIYGEMTKATPVKVGMPSDPSLHPTPTPNPNPKPTLLSLSLSLSLPLALTLTQVGIHPAVRGKVNMGAETRRADLLATLQGFRPGAGIKGALVVSYLYP